jgi:hypothetical protein
VSDRLLHLLDHPLFAHHGTWRAEGWYVEEHEALLAAGGSLHLERDDEHWVLTSTLRFTLVDQPDMIFHNAFAFETPAKDQREIFWSCPTPNLGTMAGRFTVVADGVLSLGFAEDGHHILNECYLLTDDDTYEVRGALSRDGRTVGSWAVSLDPGGED